MTSPNEPPTAPPVNPAAQVIDYAPALRHAKPDPRATAPSPYETLAYLAYVLPARIYAANPWLLDPKYQDWLQDPKQCQDWLDSLTYPEH